MKGGYINRLSPRLSCSTPFTIFLYFQNLNSTLHVCFFSAFKKKASFGHASKTYKLHDMSGLFLSAQKRRPDNLCPAVASLCSNICPVYTCPSNVLTRRVCLAVASLRSKLLEYIQSPESWLAQMQYRTCDVLFFLCLSKAGPDRCILQNLVFINACLRTVSLFCSYIILCSSWILAYIKMGYLPFHVCPLLCLQKLYLQVDVSKDSRSNFMCLWTVSSFCANTTLCSF